MVRKRSCFGVRYQFRSAQNLPEVVQLLMKKKLVLVANKTTEVVRILIKIMFFVATNAAGGVPQHALKASNCFPIHTC